MCGIPSGKQAHMELVRKHSSMVISACWATVNWSWPKSGIGVCRLIFHLTKKKKKKKEQPKWGIIHQTFPAILACEKNATVQFKIVPMCKCTPIHLSTFPNAVCETVSMLVSSIQRKCRLGYSGSKRDAPTCQKWSCGSCECQHNWPALHSLFVYHLLINIKNSKHPVNMHQKNWTEIKADNVGADHCCCTPGWWDIARKYWVPTASGVNHKDQEDSHVILFWKSQQKGM